MEDRLQQIENSLSELLKDVSDIKGWIQRHFNSGINDSIIIDGAAGGDKNDKQIGPNPDIANVSSRNDFFEDDYLCDGGDDENGYNTGDDVEPEPDTKVGILPSINVQEQIPGPLGFNEGIKKLVVVLDKIPQKVVENLSMNRSKSKEVSEPKMPVRKSNRVVEGKIIKTKVQPTSIVECLYKRKETPVKNERVRIRTKKPKCSESDPDYSDGTSSDSSDHEELKISNNDDKKECHICKKLLFPKSLKEHLMLHERDSMPKALKCDACGKLYHFLFELNKHKRDCRNAVKKRKSLRKVQVKTPVQCQQCFKILASKRQLWEHNFIHLRETAEKSLTCELCGENFAFQLHLKKHKYSVHKGEGNLKCKICSKQFQRHSSLRNHLKAHEQTPICHICGTIVSTTNNLKAHIAKHSDLKRDFFCHMCPKNFKTKGVLEKHIKSVHLAMKDFVCSFENCKRAFFTQVSLKIHQEIHENKTYFCEFCVTKNKQNPISYNSPHSLKRHINKIHQRERNFEFRCNICNASYRKVFSLEYHIKRTHNSAEPQQQENQNDQNLPLVMENADAETEIPIQIQLPM